MITDAELSKMVETAECEMHKGRKQDHVVYVLAGHMARTMVRESLLMQGCRAEDLDKAFSRLKPVTLPI